MKTPALLLAALAGLSVGVLGTSVLRANASVSPPAYVVAEEDVTDPAGFQKYAAQVPPTIAAFGGHYVVRGGRTDALEGAAPQRFVIVTFESMQKARAWYDSPAYAAIRPLRQHASRTRAFIAEGLSPP